MPTRATSNTARIHQLGAIFHTGSFLEGVGEEKDVRKDEEDAEDAEDHMNYCNRARLNRLHLLLTASLSLRRLSSLNHSIRRFLL